MYVFVVLFGRVLAVISCFAWLFFGRLVISCLLCLFHKLAQVWNELLYSRFEVRTIEEWISVEDIRTLRGQRSQNLEFFFVKVSSS